MKRKNFPMRIIKVLLLAVCLTMASAAPAQNWGKVITGLWKTHQAMTITDERLAQMVSEEVAYMDQQNKVLGYNNSYSKRLRRVMSGINSVEDFRTQCFCLSRRQREGIFGTDGPTFR